MAANCCGPRPAMPPRNWPASTASVFQAFAHAHDGGQAGLQGGDRLLQDRFIRLPEILAPFAVPDDHVGAARGPDHGGAHFAGIGALPGPKQVLRSDADARARGSLNGRREACERRADDDLAVLRPLDQGPEPLEKCGGFGGRLVHLPIARHDWLSHTINGKKLVPFSIRTPKFSATVWPMSESEERSPRSAPARAPGP